MKAFELIEKGWCQGVYALDNQGREVDARDEDAVKFCTIGALLRTYPDFVAFHKKTKLLAQALKQEFNRTVHITQWNDDPGQTQENVVAFLKKLDI